MTRYVTTIKVLLHFFVPVHGCGKFRPPLAAVVEAVAVAGNKKKVGTIFRRQDHIF